VSRIPTDTPAKEAAPRWTARDTVRALRGERAAILQSWQAEIKARLWHLDQGLLTRRGPALHCAGETLTALVDYHLSRAGSAAPSALQAEPSEAGPEMAGEEEADLLAPAAAQSMEPCTSLWTALPVSWPDLQVMLTALAAEVRRALAHRRGDAEARDMVDGALETLFAAVAGQRAAQLEQQLAAQREEAIRTEHLAGRFLANASHELRTPLTAVLGFAELLLEETYGPLTSEQQTAIGHIENSAQNLQENVNNLLDLLHFRSGKLHLQYRPLPVAPLLRHLFTILMPLAERKRVLFHTELPESLGEIEADESIVRHIVYHLLSSALRATPEGGQVVLRAERGSNALVVTTEDTALHLPPEAIANMMDPFPRLENSPARGYEGWEVGLPLVRRYVELHGGALELESAPDRGTVFRLILPTTRAGRTGQGMEENEKPIGR